MNRLRTLFFTFALLAPTFRAPAAESRPNIPPFTPVDWLPVVEPELAKAKAVSGDLRLDTTAREGRIGDTVTVLVQETKGDAVRQWVVVLAVNGISAKESKLRSGPLVIYFDNGHSVTFGSREPAGIQIHVLGPYSADHGSAKAKNVWSGSLVNPEFLTLGLDRAVEFLLRLRDMAVAAGVPANEELGMGMSSKPFAPDVAARNAAKMQRWHVTPDEERAMAGMAPALIDFFQIASQTPGVRDIVFDVLDIPWWSLVTHGGRIDNVYFSMMPPFERLSAADWGLPADTPVYSIGMQLLLANKPALNCQFAVTAPRPPLLATAGIIGVAASRPDGKGPRLMLRVMGGHPAPIAPITKS